MSRDASLIDLDLIRSQITVPQVLALYGIPSDQGNILCLWHSDRTPSCQVFNDHLFCHGCRKWKDIFSIVMIKEKLPLERAVEWLMERKGILPETVIQKAPKEYLGALPLGIANYWHKELTSERRQYLYDRMLLDDTLDRYKIGFRPDYNAYTIPFWEGVPGKSEIVALQYRAAPNSPSSRKYWWEAGRYKPCVFNAYLINDEMTGVVFGTFDSLLAGQDNLPLISASGLNTFANPKKAESVFLRDLLKNTKYKFVIPDGTQVEFEAATEVMYTVGAEIKYFPFYVPKDYTAYRQAGFTREQFIDEVLEMPTWKDKHLYAVHEIHLEDITKMLELISAGDKTEVFRTLQKIVGEGRYGSGCVTQSLAMDALKGPQHFGNTFTSEEWSNLIDEVGECRSYTDLVLVIGKYGDIAAARLGGF